LPNFAFETAQLTRLPPEYLSTKLCVLDFDQAFLTEHPPGDLARIPVPFLAPESIFTLTNGPAADVWAFGSVLFNLRKSTRLFSNFASCDPESTVLMMQRVLGDLPEEWLTFPFLDGYPVHEPLQPDIEYDTFEHADKLVPAPWVHTLEQHINQILEPRRPVTKTNPSVGVEKFCLQVPDFDGRDREGLKKFMADNATHIRKEDAALFTSLLRRIFVYDHRSRITAKQILEHPWFRGPGQTPPLAQPKQVAQKSGEGTNQHKKTLNRIVPVQHPAPTASTVTSKTMSATKKAPPPPEKTTSKPKTGAAGLPQKGSGVPDAKKDEERKRKAKKPTKR
jgi:serine/threonine protein kinase